MQTGDSGEFRLVPCLKLSQLSHSFSNKYFIQQIISKHHESPSHWFRQWRGHSSEQDRHRSGLHGADVLVRLLHLEGNPTPLPLPTPLIQTKWNRQVDLTTPGFFTSLPNPRQSQMMAMFHAVGKMTTHKDVPSYSLEPKTMWPQMTKGIWRCD